MTSSPKPAWVANLADRTRYALRALSVLAVSLAATGCATGYITAKQLESNGQGPAACDKSCHELGMEMGAFVLVSDSLPACACVPANGKAPASTASSAAAGGIGGYVVVAAAAAAQQHQQQPVTQVAQPVFTQH